MVLRIVYALCTALLCYYRHTTLFLKLLKLCAKTTWFDIYIYIYICTADPLLILRTPLCYVQKLLGLIYIYIYIYIYMYCGPLANSADPLVLCAKTTWFDIYIYVLRTP